MNDDTYNERKKIYDIIKNNTIDFEYEELFRIIHKGNEKYDENKNGIFFNLLNISDETFFKINEYIKFCIH
jgi:hypothetical protein